MTSVQDQNQPATSHHQLEMSHVLSHDPSTHDVSQDEISSSARSQGDILIVDDTAENLRLLSAMLSRAGYKVRQALTGKMALTAAQTLVPDLILLDIMMPDMDGYATCLALKNNVKTAEVPIIFLSALGASFDKVKAFQVGGIDYITKPFQVEEVLIRIQNQLNLKFATQQIHQLNTQLEARVKERTRQLEIANAQLLNMALHDALTGLANRVLFMEHLERALNAIKVNPRQRFALLFLDCDHFKLVNDSLGHLVGDELLIAIAHRLSGFLGPQQTLARLGGDEFAILLTNLTHGQEAEQVATGILQLLNQSFQLKNHEVFINASIGIALGHENYDKPEFLLRDADTAMYAAKSSGPGHYCQFVSTMHDVAMSRLSLKTDLHKALENEELVLHYQPIVHLQTGKIHGFEALIRWQHPRHGLLNPGEFISIAEETGLINPIGQWVLQRACTQLQQWRHLAPSYQSLTVSINLAPQQFSQPDLVQQIETILAATDLPPHCLNLELTENTLITNAQLATTLLKQLQERQITISLDDFGTGYSSLNYLHSFPVNVLKIDRTFIQRLDGTPDSLGLVPLIIDIARAMAMTVVAEGIETPEHVRQLQALQCDYGQGYWLAKPMAAHHSLSFLNNNAQGLPLTVQQTSHSQL